MLIYPLLLLTIGFLLYLMVKLKTLFEIEKDIECNKNIISQLIKDKEKDLSCLNDFLYFAVKRYKFDVKKALLLKKQFPLRLFYFLLKKNYQNLNVNNLKTNIVFLEDEL